MSYIEFKLYLEFKLYRRISMLKQVMYIPISFIVTMCTSKRFMNFVHNNRPICQLSLSKGFIVFALTTKSEH